MARNMETMAGEWASRRQNEHDHMRNEDRSSSPHSTPATKTLLSSTTKSTTQQGTGMSLSSLEQNLQASVLFHRPAASRLGGASAAPGSSLVSLFDAHRSKLGDVGEKYIHARSATDT